MATESIPPTIDIYPSPIRGGDHLAIFNWNSNTPLPEAHDFSQLNTRTVIILDASASMKNWVNRVLTSVLPKVFQNLAYHPHCQVDLILFDKNFIHRTLQVDEFKDLTYGPGHGTRFSPIFNPLESIFSHAQPRTFFRILTISDGEVESSDAKPTLMKASKLLNKLKKIKNLTISSNAIRLFTSKSNPDTRALSAILQLNNNSCVPKLIDIDLYDAKFNDSRSAAISHCIQVITKALSVDSPSAYLSVPTNAQNHYSFESNKRLIFKSNPWEEKETSYLMFSETKFLFWLDAKRVKPHSLLTITVSDAISITPTFHDSLNQVSYQNMIEPRLEYYAMQAKLLYIVGTTLAYEDLDKIANYFISLETQLDFITVLDDSNRALDEANEAYEHKFVYQNRIIALKKRFSKVHSTLCLRMQETVNLNRSLEFNAAQAANFLRQTDISTKTAKNLAHRHGSDLDFTSVIRAEVVALVKAWDEFETSLPIGFEDKLPTSFVSLGNTLDGIRALYSLATSTWDGISIPLEHILLSTDSKSNSGPTSLLDSMDDVEILSFFNLVGIPCQGTIGDYPDPYRYNINIIFSGHHCSLSDVMLHDEIQPNDLYTSLLIPGYSGALADFGRIDNVIPILPSILFNFIHKHAPRVLQYYASIGMRRVIADIPGTLPATLSAAFLKMMKLVSIEPTYVNVAAFVDLYHGYQATSSIRYNQPQYDQLFYAIRTAHQNDQNTAHPSTFSPPASQSSPEEQLNSEPTSTDVLSVPNLHVIKSAVKTPFSPTGSFLPAVTHSLSELLLPLINLYRIVAQYEEGLNIDIMGKNAKLILTTHSHLVSDNAIPDYTTVIKLIQKYLPTIFRAIYANESWANIRQEYNGKVNKKQLVEQALYSLVGFDPLYSPLISPDLSEDPDFDEEEHSPHFSLKFYQSNKFRQWDKGLSKLNIIFAFPQFGCFFGAVENGKNLIELTNIAKKTIPSLLTSNETAAQIMGSKIACSSHPADASIFTHHPQTDKAQKQFIQALQDTAFGKSTESTNVINSKYVIKTAKPVIKTAKPIQLCQPSAHSTPEQIYSMAHLSHFTLINILYAYQYPDFNRYISLTNPTAASNPMLDTPTTSNSATTFSTPFPSSLSSLYTSILPNYCFDPISPQECQILIYFNSIRLALYKKKYDALVMHKINRVNRNLGLLYVQALVQHFDITSFVRDLQNGIEYSPKFTYSFQKYGHQDPFFHSLWDQLVSSNNDVPLRLQKLRYIILGVTENNEMVWNNGHVLFQYSLQSASHFFYQADQRDQWIDICKQHAIGRKKWAYRPSDIPNRHYHHASRPSFYALGYDTIINFKRHVTEDEFNQYRKEHHFCCGIRQDFHKPDWFRNIRSPEDYARENIGTYKTNKFKDISSELVVWKDSYHSKKNKTNNKKDKSKNKDTNLSNTNPSDFI